jgi:hypothetical protein
MRVDEGHRDPDSTPLARGGNDRGSGSRDDKDLEQQMVS